MNKKREWEKCRLFILDNASFIYAIYLVSYRQIALIDASNAWASVGVWSI